MRIRFKIGFGIEAIIGSNLVYRRDSYSFDMAPRVNGMASVLVDDLNLEVNRQGQIVSIWGVCPDTRWGKASLTPPPARPGILFAVPDQPFRRGISIRVNKDRYLPVFVDWESGWINIRSEERPALAVRMFAGAIAEIGERGGFSSLWLRPTIE